MIKKKFNSNHFTGYRNISSSIRRATFLTLASREKNRPYSLSKYRFTSSGRHFCLSFIINEWSRIMNSVFPIATVHTLYLLTEREVYGTMCMSVRIFVVIHTFIGSSFGTYGF
jgi:hypothetical protein